MVGATSNRPYKLSKSTCVVPRKSSAEVVQYHLRGTLANQCVGRAELSVPTMTDVMWATAAADLQVCVPLGTLRYMASLDGTDCAPSSLRRSGLPHG